MCQYSHIIEQTFPINNIYKMQWHCRCNIFIEIVYILKIYNTDIIAFKCTYTHNYKSKRRLCLFDIVECLYNVSPQEQK